MPVLSNSNGLRDNIIRIEFSAVWTEEDLKRAMATLLTRLQYAAPSSVIFDFIQTDSYIADFILWMLVIIGNLALTEGWNKNLSIVGLPEIYTPLMRFIHKQVVTGGWYLHFHDDVLTAQELLP